MNASSQPSPFLIMDYDSDDALDKKQPLSLEGIFEIREFIDCDGKETGNEVVNLLEEMDEIEKKIGALTSAANDSNASLPENDKMKMFASSMKELSSRVQREQQPKSDEEYIQRDIKRNVTTKAGVSTSGESTPNEAFDRLDNLEKEEEEWQAESEAADRLRQQERDFQKTTLPVASEGGWKKGFFKKPPQAKLTKASKEEAAIKSQHLSEGCSISSIELDLTVNPPRAVKFAATPPAERGSTDNFLGDYLEKAGQPYQNNDAPSAFVESKPIPSSLKKLPPVSKAFTGNVMERFP